MTHIQTHRLYYKLRWLQAALELKIRSIPFTDRQTDRQTDKPTNIP